MYLLVPMLELLKQGKLGYAYFENMHGPEISPGIRHSYVHISQRWCSLLVTLAITSNSSVF